MNLIRQGLIAFREEGFVAFLRASSRYIFWTLLGPVFSPLVIREFRQSSDQIANVSEAIDFAQKFSEMGITIRPLQVQEEIKEFIEMVERLRPRTVLEIGTSSGGTLFLLAKVADPEAKIVSIDLPGGRFGAGYPRYRIPLYKAFSQQKQRLYLLRCDSHDDATLMEAEKVFGSHGLDLLFLDGDHTYEGVKKDFRMYGRLVREGGTIAFHDICQHGPESSCGVDRFWAEIKDQFMFTEIIHDREQGWAGIGIIHL